MRNRLLAAAALAPLCVAGLQSPAWAATDTISNSQGANVSTATAVSGGPGDVDVASGGTLNPGGGAGVTINSNNVVTVEGAISISNADNSVGVLANPGVTSSITNSGTITISESYTAATNSDGYSQAPFATGNNRYGIETLGAFNGSVTNTGTVTVQANNSYGVAILGGLAGNLSVGGTVSLTGDHGVGVYTAGEITGPVTLNGTVSARGASSIGVQTTGPIDGSLTVYGTLTATGYASTLRPTTSALLNSVQGTASQVEQGGTALLIQGNVRGGVFLAAPPTGTVTTDTTTDLDLDGVVDSVEGTSSVTGYGSAPALQIGGPSLITLGNFGACNSAGSGPGDNCFGLIVEGSISGQGVYDGVAATGADIGVGGAGVNASGGIRIASTGSITATASQANATALQLESGVQGSLLQNEGTITSSVTSATNNSSNAILIQAGAALPQVVNLGSITAGVTGDSASAYAFVDNSGSVNNVVNSGTVSANITPTNAGETTTGKTIAFDLSHNTTGVSFSQTLNGSVTPSIVGDVLLSPTGVNTVNLLSGSLHGALSLGSAAGTSLTIDNGASYVGALSYTGSGLAINVNNGTLQNNNALQNNATGAINASSLKVGSSGVLIVALDPANPASPNTRYNVSGAATFASGAKVGATLLSTPVAGQTFTIVQASSLSVASSSALLSTTPFLFTSSVQANTAAGTLSITIEPKTPTQLGLNKAETAAFPAIYAALPQDSGIQNAIINAQNSSSFHSAYQLLLPDSAGDVFEVISTMSKSVANASTGAAGFVGSGSVGAQAGEEDEQSRGGLWASEYIIGLNQARANSEAYDAVGLGLIGGLDIGGFGGTLSFASANVSKPNDPGDSIVSVSRLEAGLYTAPSFGILHTDFRVGVGYLKISDRREFAANVTSGDLSTTSTVSRTANGSWQGYDLNARAGVGAEFDFGRRFFLQPQAHLDFLDVSEGAYSESGGGSGYDLNVSARSSTQSSVTAGVVAGLRYGTNFVFKPQIELGWDQVMTGGPGMTTARFAYGGSSFTVPANAVGGAGVLRLSLKGDGDYVHFDINAGGEFRSDYQNADIRAVFRISY